jgi:hypothetical protein
VSVRCSPPLVTFSGWVVPTAPRVTLERMFGRQPPKGRPETGLKAIVETRKPSKAHPTRYLEEMLPVLVDLAALFPLPVFYAEPPAQRGL